MLSIPKTSSEPPPPFSCSSSYWNQIQVQVEIFVTSMSIRKLLVSRIVVVFRSLPWTSGFDPDVDPRSF